MVVVCGASQHVSWRLLECQLACDRNLHATHFLSLQRQAWLLHGPMARTDTLAFPRLRILFVTSLFPYGESTGTRVRIRSIGDVLRRIGDVSLSVCPLGKIDEAELAMSREEYADVDVAPAHPTRIEGLIPRLRHEFDPTFLNTHALGVDEPGRVRLLSNLAHTRGLGTHHSRGQRLPNRSVATRGTGRR